MTTMPSTHACLSGLPHRTNALQYWHEQERAIGCCLNECLNFALQQHVVHISGQLASQLGHCRRLSLCKAHGTTREWSCFYARTGLRRGRARPRGRPADAAVRGRVRRGRLPAPARPPPGRPRARPAAEPVLGRRSELFARRAVLGGCSRQQSMHNSTRALYSCISPLFSLFWAAGPSSRA